MPDHANLTITVRPCRFNGAGERLPCPVELMVARNDLERTFAPVTKDDEVSDQCEEPSRSNTPRSRVSISRGP